MSPPRGALWSAVRLPSPGKVSGSTGRGSDGTLRWAEAESGQSRFGGGISRVGKSFLCASSGGVHHRSRTQLRLSPRQRAGQPRTGTALRAPGAGAGRPAQRCCRADLCPGTGLAWRPGDAWFLEPEAKRCCPLSLTLRNPFSTSVGQHLPPPVGGKPLCLSPFLLPHCPPWQQLGEGVESYIAASSPE